jgi:hypothetical protein
MWSMTKLPAFFRGIAAVAFVGLTGCGPADDDAPGAGGTSASGGSSGSSGSSGSGGSSGSSGSGGTGGTGAGMPSGRTLWTVTSLFSSLIGIDTGSHETVLDVEVYGESPENLVSSLAVSADQVWIARDDGVLAIVDRDTGKVAGETDITSFSEGESTDIYNLTVGDGAAFTFPESSQQPELLRVDAASLEVSKHAEVLDPVGYPTSISFDGTDLWITEWNSFDLVRVNPATLEVRARVLLGQDPDDPSAFGPFYGFGYGADTGDTIWIIDTEVSRLLAVDKATLTPRIVSDLSDLTDFDTGLQFEGNAKGTFLLLDEPGIIVRFDPSTGARLNTYDFSDDDGVGMFALASDKLYVTPGGSGFVYDVREVDIESGNVLQTIHSQASLNLIGVQK